MTRRQYFAVCDTETTIKDTVADFAIAICDRQGNIVKQCAILVYGQFTDCDLFYNTASAEFSRAKAIERKNTYMQMLENGTRILASVNAINRWIEKAVSVYKPTLTAYNLAFDESKCRNTGIDLTKFPNSFCLWHAAIGNICNSREYKKFALENHRFNNPTGKGNMTFQTDAETVAGFLNGEITAEPHTALEDAVQYEIPILRKVITRRNWKEKAIPYNWKEFQVKNHFKVR